MATENKKNRQVLKEISEISSPTIEAKHVSDAEFIPIQPFRGKNSLSDSRRASISSSTFSSLKPNDFESDAISLKSQRSISADSGISSLPETSNPYSNNKSLLSTESTAKNISTEESFESFKNRGSHDFIYEGSVDDMLSSLSFNDIDRNPRSLSSFSTFSDSKITYPESNKSKRRMSSDSGISSLSEISSPYSSNESLFSTGGQDITEDSGDEKISTNKNQFASISRRRAQRRTLRDDYSTMSNLESESSDINNSSSASVIDESLGNITKKVNPKDQLSSQIDKFIPQVKLSARKTVEERVKYGTLDMLKINVERLNLKMKKVDSLLKNRSLAKVDKNNNDKALLVTEKDIPLLKELKHDLNKELKKANKQLSKETKKVKIFEQSKQQDKILKGDITKIKEAISTAKSEVNLKERYNSLLHQLGKVQTRFSHNKKLHPDLKEAITELRRERWASQTNIWAIKPNDTTKNYLPESKFELTFAEKKEIFSRKRDVAKSLLDSHQYKGEDKKILKGLYKLYSNLAKSSENKPKEKSNLERAFKREFGNAYEESCSTRLSEVSVSQPASSLSK